MIILNFDFGYNLLVIIFHRFLVSVFFTRAKIAAACGGIFYMITYVPYMYISIMESAGVAQPVWAKTISVNELFTFLKKSFPILTMVFITHIFEMK